jgi:VWFA-related protein
MRNDRRRQCLFPGLLLLGTLLLGGEAVAAEFCAANVGDLQAALLQAAGNGEDDRIQIVQGTYPGNFVYGSTEVNALEVLGGYSAGCAGRTLDPANTVLDGAGADTTLALASSAAAAFSLEGVTLTGGNRSGRGGGLYLSTAGDAALGYNRIAYNEASSHGGGAYIDADGAVTLTHNAFTGNATSNAVSNGGGLYLYRPDTATLTGNAFTDNAGSSGGGLYIDGPGTATLTGNAFTDNAGSNGGGLYLANAGTVSLAGNALTGNTGSSRGGGLYLANAGTVTLTGNALSGNSSSRSGAGLYLNNPDIVTFTNNRFRDNVATGSDTYGGGAYVYGGDATLTNNSFETNGAAYGGGLGVYLRSETDEAWIYNNIFWADTASQGQGNDLWIENDGDNDFVPSPLALVYNDFDQTATSGYWTHLPIAIDASNLDGLDPLFADEYLHLSADSPMIDGGDDGAPALPATDMDGDARITGTAVDIGADEYGGSSTPRHDLSVLKSGNGTVSSRDGLIDCGGTCGAEYPQGTQVTLDASPDAGWDFDGWSGPCFGTGSCTVAMNSDLTVTATFDPSVYTLTVDKIGTGTGTAVSSPGSIDCGSTCSDTFDYGQSVDLTATADSGSGFHGWGGCNTDNGDQCSIVMSSDRVVTATFNDATTTSCATMTIHQTDSSSCPSLRTILSIQDEHGQPVTGLLASDFALEEDGVARAVQLETGGALAVSLVIDKSGSLSATGLRNIRQAGVNFINLLSQGDSVAVYQFDSTVSLLQDYTTDLSLAIAAVNSIAAPGGSTALYDAIFAAAEHADNLTGRKGLVVLTDGRSNASRHSIDEAIDQAIAAGVPVFTIGFGNADPAVLAEIADQSGGLYYAGATSADLQDLLSRLGAVLSSQYVLKWNTAFLGGDVHGIVVEAHWDSCTLTETATCDQAGSPCGASCMAERTLPTGYAAGSPAPVALAVKPIDSVQTYALEDIPPAGTAVSNISSGGLLDNGRVKWGPFSDNDGRDFSYEVTPPAGTRGSIGWGGVFSRDGISEAICGDPLLPEGLVHPADLGALGDNWRIEIDELTAYTTAWKTGAGSSRAPSPIPVDYAVNAGYLWQNGQDYHYDPFLDPPWDAGVAPNSIIQSAAQMSDGAVSSFSAGYYTPGVPVDVTLAIFPPASTQAYAVEETPPEGWMVTDISDEGTFDAQSSQIRWGLFLDDAMRELTYRVTPAMGATGARDFIGQAAFDSEVVPIGGQRALSPGADIDCLDVDGNGSVEALTDGILTIRYEFGFRGQTLVDGAVGTGCTRCTAAQIEPHLAACMTASTIDIDGNGSVEALTDGILTIRYEFGFRGQALIDGAVGTGCTRCTAQQIEAYLAGLML